jgi:hypothetical protein
MVECVKCKLTSGNDFSQCGDWCPRPESPHYVGITGTAHNPHPGRWKSVAPNVPPVEENLRWMAQGGWLKRVELLGVMQKDKGWPCRIYQDARRASLPADHPNRKIKGAPLTEEVPARWKWPNYWNWPVFHKREDAVAECRDWKAHRRRIEEDYY